MAQSLVASRFSRSVKNWLRLPSRLALLLGVGALSVAGADTQTARAHLGKEPWRVPQQGAKSFGQVQIWTEDGRIYISEAGKPAQELPLGDTAEARQLRELLRNDGASAGSPRVLLDRMILVGGGGEGFHWAPAGKDRGAEKPDTPAATGFGPPAAGSAAQPARSDFRVLRKRIGHGRVKRAD